MATLLSRRNRSTTPHHRHSHYRTANRHTPTTCIRCADHEYGVYVSLKRQGFEDPLGLAERICRDNMLNW